MCRPFRAALVAVTAAGLLCGAAPGVSADETDNFSCRAYLSRDSREILDSWVNAQIRKTLDRVNRRGQGRAAEAVLVRELQKAMAASVPQAVTFIPHSRFVRWVEKHPQVDRCRLEFAETIYGAKPYNQPWLYPFLGRTLFVADSLLLSGRIVGVDKINHFIREGLDYWRAVNRRGEHIDAVLAREFDPAGWEWRWTESGIKGLSTTGVLSYADVAAAYWGFRFYSDLLTPGKPLSLVAFDPARDGFVQVREFTFADYVNDAWDEGINFSAFHPSLGREVAAALSVRGLTMPVRDCKGLAELPDARLYLNPACQTR